MKRLTRLETLKRSFLGVLALLAWLPAAYAMDPPLEWPRTLDTEKGKLVLYQPQLESFSGDRLTARAAVSGTPKGKEQPIFGAVWIEARVRTDRDNRTVEFLAIDVKDVRFPGASKESIAEVKKRLEWALPKWVPTVSLDRLLTMLELVEKEKVAAEGLKNEPPEILFVTHPAMLVTLDGDPRLTKVEGSSLMRVANTPFLILFDTGSATWYLKGGDRYLSASDVMGPWQAAKKVPAAVAAAGREAAGHTASENKAEESEGSGRMPQIIVATRPTELIETAGPPEYTPVRGTSLLFVSNTGSDLFMEIESQRTFALLSGRWFAAKSTEGPWEYVAAENLPADFSRIPEGSPKASVLSSIPGTEAAKEAVLDSHIPQTAAVKRGGPALTVVYDGPPKFTDIEGTQMSYAANSGYSVIRVGAKYYCCHQAVWYEADSPMGPWRICVKVPEEIYTIPPSCPVYSVKYVYVYDHTPDVVYVGYTPGYVGCYVHHGVVVYGTGYVYRGWYGHVYYPRPVTWGVAVRYNSYTGNWGFAAGRAGYYGGWVVRGGGSGGWYGYGGYRGWRGGDIDIDRSVTTPRGTWSSSINIDRDWDGDIDIDRDVSFEPNENIYNRRENREKLATPEGRKQAKADIKNRGEGAKTDLSARRGDTAGAQNTKADIKARRDAAKPDLSTRRGDTAGAQKAKADAALANRRTAPKTGASGGSATSRRANDVFTDSKGNVYRHSEKGWQQRSGNSWSNKGAAKRPAARQQTLNRDYKARQRGAQRTRNYQKFKRSSRSRNVHRSRGSGGRRGGGRRR